MAFIRLLLILPFLVLLSFLLRLAVPLVSSAALYPSKSCLLLDVQRLLILGWGDGVLMTDLLSELDHGPSALRKGSEVTLFNTRSSQEVMGAHSILL